MCRTVFCGGDLSSFRVDLEEGRVESVGDLADQAVAQLSVGGLWVVLIRRKHTGKWDTWNNSHKVRFSSSHSRDVSTGVSRAGKSNDRDSAVAR